jgi:hypothetical protein
MSSLQELSRRFVVGSHAITQGLANFPTDLRLLSHRSRNGVVLKAKNLRGFQMIVRERPSRGLFSARALQLSLQRDFYP